MADLIIRPKNDDHLKLQNDAGTTILELANDESKLRLAQNNISASDGTTAITTSGANVTLAGTANNIGTVTSGTFNGTIGTSASGSANLPAVKTALNASGSAPIYACRAWVNFRGTTQSGTATASGLVSGQYTATVTSATQFTVVYSSTTYTINTSGNHEIAGGVVGQSEGVDLTVSGTSVTIDTQIRASGNVSSITDKGTGNYDVNFTTAMSDANYSGVASHSAFNQATALVRAYNTGYVNVGIVWPGVAFYDPVNVSVAIFR